MDGLRKTSALLFGQCVFRDTSLPFPILRSIGTTRESKGRENDPSCHQAW